MPDVVSPRSIADSLAELWSPRVVADVDDNYVKVAKVHGEFGWHAHTDEDELFLVLQGRLRIEFEDDAVDLFQEFLVFVFLLLLIVHERLRLEDREPADVFLSDEFGDVGLDAVVVCLFFEAQAVHEVEVVPDVVLDVYVVLEAVDHFVELGEARLRRSG